jgi:fructokinase
VSEPSAGTNGKPRRFGAVEAGGTKWVCAIGDDDGGLLETTTFATTTPPETLSRAVEFFSRNGPVAALGVGCFGPVDIRPSSPTWGQITSTPKPGWANTDVARTLEDALDTRVAFDTDVNASALGELALGAARGLDTFCYITVGTGIGAGIVVNRQLVHGLVHPEFGHMRVPHDWSADPFPGSCPFHGDCLEGLASGGSLRVRWSRPGEQLDDEAVWRLEAGYLAAGIVNLVCTISPERIIVGGGVMQHEGLFPLVRERVRELLANYIEAPEIDKRIDEYIVPPQCGTESGVLGGLELARQLIGARPHTAASGR